MSHLTNAQLVVLKTAIQTEVDPTFVGFRNSNDRSSMATWFNLPSTTVVWKSSVTRDSVTVEGFDWTQVDNLSVGQGRIWDLLFDTQSKAINAAEPGKRAAISECWKGTAAKVAVATFVLSKCTRFASKFEALYKVGTGTALSPAVAPIEGNLNRDHIDEALEVV